MIVKEKYKKPLVITGHGYDVYDLPFRDKYWRNRLREVFRNADSLITVSLKNRECIIKLGIKKEVYVFPNGFSSSIFNYIEKQKAKKILNLLDQRKIVLSVGSLEKVKGYDILIKALNILSRYRKDFLFLLIGEGTEEGNLKKLISKYKLDDYVKLIGGKPHNELVYWFGACDFFVSSSLFEGNPTVMFESLGCGKPFIGTKVGGIPDVINSPHYGILSQPGDEKELAKNIFKALEEEWDSRKILEYSKLYTWENITQNLIELYQKLL
ncbi:unnamed protein product [marine sediment metagenome]|uniref:Glycosyl transferase family 1 domain-containing protein n=1 Tax=marine sediment metagenome TaxID=412755 RepID=X1RJ35_9ZZZZ